MSIQLTSFDAMHDLMKDKITKDDITIISGNGGFAAMSDHFAGELIPLGYPIVATSSLATITAIANDHSYNETIIKYICAFIPKNIILMTTSGTSSNVMEALEFIGRRIPHVDVWLISGSSPKLLTPTDEMYKSSKHLNLWVHKPAAYGEDESDKDTITARRQESTLRLLHEIYLSIKRKEEREIESD